MPQTKSNLDQIYSDLKLALANSPELEELNSKLKSIIQELGILKVELRETKHDVSIRNMYERGLHDTGQDIKSGLSVINEELELIKKKIDSK